MEKVKGVHELTEEIEMLAVDESGTSKAKGKPRSRRKAASVAPVEVIEIL